MQSAACRSGRDCSRSNRLGDDAAVVVCSFYVTVVCLRSYMAAAAVSRSPSHYQPNAGGLIHRGERHKLRREVTKRAEGSGAVRRGGSDVSGSFVIPTLDTVALFQVAPSHVDRFEKLLQFSPRGSDIVE